MKKYLNCIGIDNVVENYNKCQERIDRIKNEIKEAEINNKINTINYSNL